MSDWEDLFRHLTRVTYRARREKVRGRRSVVSYNGLRGGREADGFLCLDGESVSDGSNDLVIDDYIRVYPSRYVLLAAYTEVNGIPFYDDVFDSSGLSFERMVEFLFRLRRMFRRKWFVTFGGNYDFVNIIKSVVPFDKVYLFEYGGIDVDGYHIDYIPRRLLRIRKIGTRHSVVVYDGYSFFQSGLLDALEKWSIEYDRRLLYDGKRSRSSFSLEDADFVRAYNRAELHAMHALYVKLREAVVSALKVELRRWYGAGAIGASFLRRNGVFFANKSFEVEDTDLLKRAYAGGRSELLRCGVFGRVEKYDINSAYPSAMVNLPALKEGKLESCSDLGEWCLAEVDFEFPHGLPFYPLFYRIESLSVVFPQRGRGFYWFPEVRAALRFCERFGGRVDIVRIWRPVVDDRVKPFSFIRRVYEVRRRMVLDSRRMGYDDGRQEVLKLGLNSLYGKTAQTIGSRVDGDGKLILPRYHNLFWAGYTTSAIRSRLVDMASVQPDRVVSFNTDGLFFDGVCGHPHDEGKNLGGVELSVYEKAVFAGAGIYWLSDSQNRFRGVEGKVDEGDVLKCWSEGKRRIFVHERRFMGLFAAASSEDLWGFRGSFVLLKRAISIDGSSSKRFGVVSLKKLLDSNQFLMHRVVDTSCPSRPAKLKFEKKLEGLLEEAE